MSWFNSFSVTHLLQWVSQLWSRVAKKSNAASTLPNPRNVRSNQGVTIKTHLGYYLCAEEGGGPQGQVIDDRPVGLITATRTEAGLWEEFIVHQLDRTHVALQTISGYYVCAEDGGGGMLVANRTGVGPWETFEVVRVSDSSVALKTHTGQFVCAELGGGKNVVCDRTEVGIWETFTPSDMSWVPSTTPVTPLQGRLRIEQDVFYDDAGPVLPLFAHAGDLFALWVRDKDRARQELDKIAQAGYHGYRVWTLLGGAYWENMQGGRTVGPKYTQNYWGEWESLVRETHARKLRLVVSQGDIGALGIDMTVRKQFAAQLAQVAKAVDGTGHVYAFVDGGNEAWQTGEPDPARLAAFVQAYRDAGGTALLTLTSPPGEEKQELNQYSIPPADCYDVHGYRDGHFWDKRRHIFSIPYEGQPNKKLGIQSEPCGSGDLVSVTDNKHELNDEALAMLALQSLIARQVWVWFSGEGVSIKHGLDTENGFYAVPKACALLPADVMTYPTLHHSGTTWKDIRIVDEGVSHDVRCDGVQQINGRFVYLFDGPPGSHTFRAAKNFTGTLYNPATGDSETLTKQKGESFTLTWERGRLFIGTVN